MTDLQDSRINPTGVPRNDEWVETQMRSQDPTKDCWQLCKRILDLMCTFLLEVLGGAGAVWGSSECAGVRVGADNDTWRAICWGAFFLCVWRWGAREFQGKVHVEMEIMAVFLLDVLGGAGAMWGCLEIAGYRSNYPENCHERQSSPQGDYIGLGGSWGPPGQYDDCVASFPDSRIVCAPVFILCWLAWQKLMVGNVSWYLRTYLLQVMGGAGALWGFSEICGKAGYSMRYGWGDVYFGQKSFDFWRVCCGVVFVGCNIRWLNVCFFPGPPADWNDNNIEVLTVKTWSQQMQEEKQGKMSVKVDPNEDVML